MPAPVPAQRSRDRAQEVEWFLPENRERRNNHTSYWGKHHDANFWIENASVEWKESEAPFHNVARLTLLRGSHLGDDEAKAVYFDVTGHSSCDSTPVGSINRARAPAEAASRKARMASAQQV